ncbi:Ankyrin repeat domain-containing protein 50-like protein 3 [Colletotrichum plurivorum]|uniref:Ankyrin repeat domain-containing protein 50-like protein 3 n=1 Tax=Colletotrichum plurivorum TaxID=2175906 RepID=A0A8H6KHV0_9PEZI|nr:Ankyrin repeat domain-containing protein 50-like protein 3 [Colletotrichum plurivorum]
MSTSDSKAVPSGGRGIDHEPAYALKTEDYTVGRVCALPLEMAAAKGMVDQIHPNLPEQDTSDHNNYILGQIQDHNIVIAGLPAGIYGTTPAATVAKDMLRTFRSIRFARVTECYSKGEEEEVWAHSLDEQASSQIMMKICVQYLNFSDIRDELFLTEPLKNKRLDSRSYPFLDYSAMYWSAHLRDTTINDSNAMELICALFNTSNARLTTWFSILLKKLSRDQEDWRADDCLLFAASNGHKMAVQHLIDTFGCSVDCTDRRKRTPLMWASIKGHEKTVRFLTKLGADVNHEGGEYGSALQSAAANSYYDIANFLVQNGAKVNAMGGSYGTALIAAVCRGHKRLAHYLVEAGANINAEIGHFASALIAACYGGHEETIQLLLQGGAEFNMQGGWFGNALQAACCGGHLAVVELLIDKGAEINALGGHHRHALQGASFSNHLQIAELLIRHGADIASMRGDAKSVHFLLERGAKIENDSGKSRSTQYGPALICASACGHHDIVRALLIHGADINVRSEAYVSCLQAASHNGHEQVVHLLLDHGIDVNSQGGPYGTALLAALASGHLKIAQILIDNGADINAVAGSFSSVWDVVNCFDLMDYKRRRFLIRHHSVFPDPDPYKRNSHGFLSSAQRESHLENLKNLKQKIYSEKPVMRCEEGGDDRRPSVGPSKVDLESPPGAFADVLPAFEHLELHGRPKLEDY